MSAQYRNHAPNLFKTHSEAHRKAFFVVLHQVEPIRWPREKHMRRTAEKITKIILVAGGKAV
ncbi:MAG: hypothetical protein EOP11_11820 [Proteobacteria bacterium]|nr:MAG: hypothetical protein EOP11_11820 [Pseudomonadota bacterium]